MLTSGLTGQGGLYEISLGTGCAALLGGFGAYSPLIAGLTAAPVPEPGSFAMLLLDWGLVGLAVARRMPR